MERATGHHERVSIRPLTAGAAFDQLSNSQQLYAHHLSRACWAGARIIHQQVSPESSTIFELIIELHHSCKGDWEKLLETTYGADTEHLESFLVYATHVLFSSGNYFGYGDTKLTPNVPSEFLDRLVCRASKKAAELLRECKGPMMATEPWRLGFPSDVAQSGYYPGPVWITKEEVEEIDRILGSKGIFPENTRVVKESGDGTPIYRVLQSCTEVRSPQFVGETAAGGTIQLEKGDNSAVLSKVIDHLKSAKEYADNDVQKEVLSKMVEHFTTGDVVRFKEAQARWIKDRSPTVESMIGFVEYYRDPAGRRAEFQGIVALTDKKSSKLLEKLVDVSPDLVVNMPWVRSTKRNEPMGPFESVRFEAPELTSIHSLAYCSSIVFLGINLPNYSDIRNKIGFKNVMIANRNLPPDTNLIDTKDYVPFIDPIYAETYVKTDHYAWYLQIALHELVGHGTGNRLIEEKDFSTDGWNEKNLPPNPLTDEPIRTFYRNGETVPSVFGKLAATLQECRADCVGLYLISDPTVLSLFGCGEDTAIKSADVIHTAYLHAAVAGIEALGVYDVDTKSWGQAHERGIFAILRTMLTMEDFVTIEPDYEHNRLTVKIDSAKILDRGRKAVESLLLKIHMWLCTADIESATSEYESLTSVDNHWLSIRDIVQARPNKPWAFIQSNTVLGVDGHISVKEYEQTPAGFIESWADRFPRT